MINQIENLKAKKSGPHVVTNEKLDAICHNGFISWDYDIDEEISKTDKNKFIEIAERELIFPIITLNKPTMGK